jgi:hypothetical protein
MREAEAALPSLQGKRHQLPLPSIEAVLICGAREPSPTYYKAVGIGLSLSSAIFLVR